MFFSKSKFIWKEKCYIPWFNCRGWGWGVNKSPLFNRNRPGSLHIVVLLVRMAVFTCILHVSSRVCALLFVGIIVLNNSTCLTLGSELGQLFTGKLWVTGKSERPCDKNVDLFPSFSTRTFALFKWVFFSFPSLSTLTFVL